MSLGRLAVQLLPTVASALTPPGGIHAGRTVRALLVEVALAAIALVFAATAFGFAVAACYMALAASLGPAAAAGWVALGLAVLAGLLTGIVAMLSARRARRHAEARLAARQAAAAPFNQIVGAVSASPIKSLLVATAAGALAGWLDRRL